MHRHENRIISFIATRHFLATRERTTMHLKSFINRHGNIGSLPYTDRLQSIASTHNSLRTIDRLNLHVSKDLFEDDNYNIILQRLNDGMYIDLVCAIVVSMILFI
jgi:hypothetical protein